MSPATNLNFDDLLLYSEDGARWLLPSNWLLMMYREHRERFGLSTDLPEAKEPELEEDPEAEEKRARAEGKTWRAGRKQGLLARTSPLRAERQRKEQTG